MGGCCDGPKCEVPGPKAEGRPSCPRCGAVGRVVGDQTIEAILRPGLVTMLLEVERRFCRAPTCDVLYYGADGRFAGKGAAAVRVDIKESADPVPLSYCLGFSRADVRKEIAETGNCTIPSRITSEVRAGRCACEVKNPSGACCLGDVNKAVNDAKDALVKVHKNRPAAAVTSGKGCLVGLGAAGALDPVATVAALVRGSQRLAGRPRARREAVGGGVHGQR